ncbi:MAG: hypothetical protein GIX00_09460 [Candidatus Eremiobacteraeota bacterium]|nr:hypothetical protein [Candidatus Eremiobacteraeota bacterium]
MGLNNTIWLVMEAYVTGKMIGGKYEVITVKRVDVTPQIRHIMREMIVDLFREDAG